MYCVGEKSNYDKGLDGILRTLRNFIDEKRESGEKNKDLIDYLDDIKINVWKDFDDVCDEIEIIKKEINEEGVNF